jgi:hypothetical protein
MTLTTVQEATVVMSLCVVILTRMITGHTPLRYISVLLLVTEALVQQALKSAWVGVEDYRTSFRATYRETKRGIAHRGASGSGSGREVVEMKREIL